MIKIPCEECITFVMCKQRVRSLCSFGRNKVWLNLYWDCKIFSKFYDRSLMAEITNSELQSVDDELHDLYGVERILK